MADKLKRGGKVSRESLSKKIRFEVFKRDSFTCQYCGNKAPQVILEVDHIEPVSKGGTNEILNLITSCFECNRGKGNRKLPDDTIVTQQQEQLEELNERRLQLEMMLNWRKELSDLDNELIDALVDEIESVSGVEVLEQGIKEVRKWFKKYDFDILLDSIEASFLQYEDASKAFNMIPRIAYYKSNPDKQVNPELFYIRGILRNRPSYLDDKKALHLLIKANQFIDDSELKEIALMCKNWTEFRETLEDYIAEYERVDSDG